MNSFNHFLLLLSFLDPALVFVWQAGVVLIVQVLFAQGKNKSSILQTNNVGHHFALNKILA